MEKQLMTWNVGLEGSALQFAGASASPIRVMAGPGTGKSFALKRRVQRLLEEGVNPKSILAFTFTRNAANDLKKDLQQLQVEGAAKIRAVTLHGLCFNILIRDEVLNITGRTPRPLLKFEENFLVQDISDPRFGGKRDKEMRLQAFNAAWARLQSEEPGWPHNSTDKAFDVALHNWLQFHEAMLIGELVPIAMRYLRDNPHNEYRNGYTHILVDEYQDLNVAEQAVAELLSSSGDIVIIGDEDQSIYSFKFAHPEGITNYHTNRPGTEDFGLDTCRRCPTLVVEMANSLIANNGQRLTRFLEPHSSNPKGDIHVIQWLTIDDEVNGVTQYIQSAIASGKMEPGKILVLSPARDLGYGIRDRLNEMDIRAVSFFTEEIFEGNLKKKDENTAEETMTLLTLLAKPEDCVALRVWCGLGSPSLRMNEWNRLRDYCESVKISPMAALDRLLNGEIQMPNTSGIIKRYQILREHHKQLSGLGGKDLAEILFPIDERWSIPFRRIIDDIEDTEISVSSLESLLRSAITHPEIPNDVDFVRVMSLHKSKGLTADLVIIVGCVEGLLPRSPRGPDSDKVRYLEEQRRLFYVGITRTTNILVLSSVVSIPTARAFKMGVQVRNTNGNNARTITSRFVGELGPLCPSALTGQRFLHSLGL